MRIIKLTQNKYVYLDQKHFDMFSKYKWHVVQKYGNFYAQRREKVNGKLKTIYLSREIAKNIHGNIDNLNVTYKDGNSLNNSSNNILVVTKNKHAQLRAGKKSKLPRGVYKVSKSNKYSSAIRVDGKRKHLGTFDTPSDAHKEYLNAVNKYFK